MSDRNGTTNGTTLAVRPAAPLANATAEDYMPVLSIEQAVGRYNAVVEYTKKVLKRDRDYGVIPGTAKGKGDPSNKDNVLLKAGAEKLCTIFGLAIRFEDYRVTEDWAQGLFYYAYRCILSRNGRDVAESIGSANSREKKYRRESRTCPDCGRPAIKKGFPKKGQTSWTWYCNGRDGGCGQNFKSDDPMIVDQAAVTDVNAAADSVNTLQKMAQKRAFVGATLIATNASEFFTQDLDDNPTDLPRSPADDADVIEGEVIDQADLADDGQFNAAVDHEADRLGITNEAAWLHAVYPTLKRETGRANGKEAYRAATPEQRAKALNAMVDATPAQVAEWKAAKPPAKTPAPAGAAEAAASPADARWTDFLSDVFDLATAQGESPETFKAVEEALAATAGAAGPSTIAQPVLNGWLAAMKAGRFDWKTSKVKPEPKSGKAA